MRLPLERLDGIEVDGIALSVEEHADERSPHPVLVHAEVDERSWVLFEGRTNPGTAWRHPWLEVRYSPWIGGAPDARSTPSTDADDAAEDATADRQPLPMDTQEALFEALGDALVPAAYVMLSCDGHPASLRALSIDVPPACTALGYLLWRAGARWYKVWYYPEGWREGHEKVQGNLPADEEHAAERTSERLEEIEAFLGTELAKEHPACAERGRRLLAEHDASASP